jgi:type II secretory pathway pseudopilin PulG
MITVSILGILASIAIPKFADMVRKAKEGATKGSLGAIRGALTIYYSEQEGQFPSALNTLTVNGKYMSSIPFLKLAPYHNDTSATVVETTIVADNNMVIGMFCDAGFPMGGVGWGYDVFASGTNMQILVCCGHTDSAGSIWSTY